MKYEDIKALSDQELKDKLAVEKDMLQKLRFAHSISPIENPLKIRHSRKLIARLMTEINRREQVKQ